MIIDRSEDDGEDFAHYGILRKSGRYPWGSGENQTIRNRTFLEMVDNLKTNEGLSDTEIARGFGMTTTQLRAAKTIAKTAEKQSKIDMAQRLKDKGLSNIAIGQRMGIGESSVRSLLAPGQKDKADILQATTNMLRQQVAEKKYLDVGIGVEHHIGVSKEKLGVAIAMLKEEGYDLHYIPVPQLGTSNKTSVKVLAAPGTTYSEVYQNRGEIKQITNFSEDHGRSYSSIQPPISIDLHRVGVRYAEQGGTAADGVIHVRRNVDDVTLGNSRYLQVRLAVNGTHYLKGMAIYHDNLPPGVDLMFNTNKKDTGNKLDAMKKMKDDPTDPFGAIVRQLPKIDAFGHEIPNTVRSAMNIVNQEGDWDKWSRSLSSQMLSKQTPALAKTQLDLTYERKKRELDEIMVLTNPVVKKRLLEAYASDADSSAVHLKAAALPRQENKVILPINSMRENEVHAPTFRDGEKVVLIRYPHGGIFEIPQLTVNNRNPEAKRLIGNAKDAIGIHSKVAERLSGADFDGDTVLVIPNDKGHIKIAAALEGLKGFDPQSAYPHYEGMPQMSGKTKGIQMGLVTNLITDMTIRGATSAELARAIRHSMVVIDAEKHNLNYKQSAINNGIPQLMKKYQTRSTGGASTLISRATSDIRVAEKKARSVKDGGPVDKATGRKVFQPTGNTYTKTTIKRGVEVTEVVPKTEKSVKLAETHDAHTLSSGKPIEKIYADHSNRLKDLANQARLESIHTKNMKYSPSAKVAYAKEVRTLDASLNLALRNSPLERAAQILANAQVDQKRHANPDLDRAELKKIKTKALEEMRVRTGAKKQRIVIGPNEWAAIQAGAVSTQKLNDILRNTDLDKVKELATPKTKLLMTSANVSKAKTLAKAGYTQAEIADALGVSVTTLKTSIGGA